MNLKRSLLFAAGIRIYKIVPYNIQFSEASGIREPAGKEAGMLPLLHPISPPFETAGILSAVI